MVKNRAADSWDDTGFEELDLDMLDQVNGGQTGPGQAAAVFSISGSIGPFSGSISYSPGNGWYTSGGVGTPGLGANVSFGIVAPFPGSTANDVLTGPSVQGAAYFGGGVSGSANTSGVVVESGLGLDLSGGVGWGAQIPSST